MLPVINLDDENYSEIFERARSMIAGIYPEWTDYNEHDPGITFLQLMAWMKEMQQFHLDQIGGTHLEMYLKILGMNRRQKVPARTLVEFRNLQGDLLLPQGTRLMARDIPFETEKSRFLEQVKLLECISFSGEGEQKSAVSDLDQGSRMRFLPFGEVPQAGGQFLMKLDRALEPGREHTIYFDVFDDYPVARNPVDRDFIPLVRLQAEYYGKMGFVPCEEVKDHTDQLLHSGLLEYQISEEMAPMEDGTFGIRLCLVSGEYDVPPVLQGISLHMVPVCQKAVLSDYEDIILPADGEGRCHFISSRRVFTEGKVEVYQSMRDGYVPVPADRIIQERGWDHLELSILPLQEKKNMLSKDIFSKVGFCIVGYDAGFSGLREFRMNGFPDQTLEMNDRELLYDQFEIIAENPERPGAWEKWERVENFHRSSPEDRHYCLNVETGTITFGDCEQGMAPEGRMKIIRCVRSLGSRGNIRRGQIQDFENSWIQGLVSNPYDVSNGSDQETIENCFTRFQAESASVSRAVTARDYELLVMRTPGLRIRQVKAVAGELTKGDGKREDNGITIVVQPFSLKPQARLSAAYMENIAGMLDRRRLIGTRVQVLSPEYIGASVFVDVTVRPHYPAAREMIEAVIRDYFGQAASHFGAELEESDLYGLLDASECVVQVRNLSMHVQGRGVRRTAGGSIQLPVNGLVYLKQADYVIMAGAE